MAGRQKVSSSSQAAAGAAAVAAAAAAGDGLLDGEGLPQKLHGVPDALRAWWSRVDPTDLLRATEGSGRIAALKRVSALVSGYKSVLDLGCGPGLLARESGRRDIVGVDMSPHMIRAARKWMDVVLPENVLEHYPSEPVDAVVLCNVLEPYPADVRQLLLTHALEFLSPKGVVIVVVASGGGGLGSASESSMDLLCPTVVGGSAQPGEIEDDLQLAGFELASAELLDTKPAAPRPALEELDEDGEVLPGPERRSYAIMVGQRVD